MERVRGEELISSRNQHERKKGWLPLLENNDVSLLKWLTIAYLVRFSQYYCQIESQKAKFIKFSCEGMLQDF